MPALLKTGAECRIRTRDLQFTKLLHYHCANPAWFSEISGVSEYWPDGREP
jgi:hypothetical protein